jgi:hypothetical protein
MRGSPTNNLMLLTLALFNQCSYTHHAIDVDLPFLYIYILCHWWMHRTPHDYWQAELMFNTILAMDQTIRPKSTGWPIPIGSRSNTFEMIFDEDLSFLNF